MTIKLNDIGRTVRETSAQFEYTAPGTDELVQEPIRVRYYSQTIAELKKLRNDILAQAEIAERDAGTADFPWLSSQLAERLESLPDILDDKSKPIKISVDNLDKITAINLRAIHDAIEADAIPRPTPAK